MFEGFLVWKPFFYRKNYQKKKGGEAKMAVFRHEEIAGFRVNEKILCPKCVNNQEEFTQENILTSHEVEESEDYYFCDECGEKIN